MKPAFVICLGGVVLFDDVQCTTTQGGGVVCNLFALYCNDFNHVDVFGVNKILIILIFANVPFTSGSWVTLTLILPTLGHSPPHFFMPERWR